MSSRDRRELTKLESTRVVRPNQVLEPRPELVCCLLRKRDDANRSGVDAEIQNEVSYTESEYVGLPWKYERGWAGKERMSSALCREGRLGPSRTRERTRPWTSQDLKRNRRFRDDSWRRGRRRKISALFQREDEAGWEG